ncbi:MAG: Ig-like domain-containing protein [Proteobacteria bacterium]|nr:Ig-like domain-containing protein [Pseudomonadota bacterium]
MKLAGGLVLLLTLATSASASPRFAPHAYVPIEPTNVAAADVPRVLWLNRCAGGCTVRPGPNSARAHTSTIPEGGASEYTIAEWQYGDAEWQKLVTCVQEVYSPYDVRVTDVKPLETYNEAIVAGSPNQIGRAGIGGIAPAGCDPYNDVISFSFANIYGGDIFEICATVAQETGHAYGMDHEYEYLDGRSACTDPMTYRQDCGGQQFFRNEFARCGEFAARDCYCGNSTQNSHLILSTRLGPGTPITAPPIVAYTSPAAGSSVTSATKIIATASAQRGIKRVELWINGYKWSEVPGIEWGPDGQPASAYQLTIPNEVPDGVLDLQVIAKDDIDVATATAVVRVTKGGVHHRRHLPARPALRRRGPVPVGSADRRVRRRLHLRAVLQERAVHRHRRREDLHEQLRSGVGGELPGGLRLPPAPAGRGGLLPGRRDQRLLQHQQRRGGPDRAARRRARDRAAPPPSACVVVSSRRCVARPSSSLPRWLS